MKKLITLTAAFCVLICFGCSGSYHEEEIRNVNQISEHICMGVTVPGSVKAAENIRSEIISLIHEQDHDVPLDVCVYGLDDEQIISALENAVAVGVHIRFIGNADGSKRLSDSSGYYYSGYRRIAAAMDKHFPSEHGLRTEWSRYKVFDDYRLINYSGIMHNKFMIFTDSEGRRTLMTGSMNLTQSCIEQNNNDVIFLTDNRIADKYTRQFEYMLGSRSHSELFERFTVDGISIDIGFSQPSSKSDYIMSRIMTAVQGCKDSAEFMIFTMTHKSLLQILRDRADTGLCVRGVFDSAQLYCSAEEILLDSSAECRRDGNEYVIDSHGGKLHHKCMILDAGGEDPTVITGSFNWTANADKQNNENVLIIHSDEAAEFYKSYFDNVWDNSKAIKR